ncbi:MAG TPA: tetratricopeptide repeat protein, partial [Allosphingosinicella sp.]|uniref:tetratricopeptide repeat protein n=1 Tax=Allosphingosinicella sp. TaxID=2823234 RepID=UPI002ED932E0
MFEPRLTIVHNGQSDAETLADLARDALSEGEEERALPYLSRAAAIRSDARLWQWTGLLFRSLDEHDDALRAFENAAHFAPSDPSIAHGYARIALEAGLHAVPLFERARQFAPANGDVLVGLAAARAAAGQGEAAAAELDAILLRAPLWIQGHIQLAQLRSVLGQGNAADASFRRALRMRPSDETLWKSLFDLHLQAERYSALKQSLAEGEKAGLTQHLLAEYKAI